MMTDPIADMLTRIRNGLRIFRSRVDVPDSKLKRSILDVLVREGYIHSFELLETKPRGTLRVSLKYGPDREQVIRCLERVSKPGRRIYRSVDEVESVLDGLGTGIYSTSSGILTDRECREKKVGGEYICRVT